MTQPMICYSPRPIGGYLSPGLLTNDREGWNLAWLSHDFDKGPPRDPNFTVLVRRTTQMVLATGEIDLAGLRPDNVKVRHLMRMPPAQAVLRMFHPMSAMQLPLLKAYGPTWFDTLHRRARLYREPFDEVLDAPITNLELPQEVLDALR